MEKNSDKKGKVKKVKAKPSRKAKMEKDDILNAKEVKAKKKKNKKIGWKIFRICLFVFIALIIIGVGVVVGVLTGIIDKTEGVNLEDLRNQNLTTYVFDSSGQTQTGEFHSSENRKRISYEDLPKYAIDAVIAIEDERYFTHHGVDLKRTLGAIFTYVINGGSSNFGGSTITQQLIKNSTNDKEGSWQRKIREWYRAVTLEKMMDKKEIFEEYVNTIYMGDGSYGIEVASQDYFGKSAKDINIAEAAVLAAIIQSPESTNPYASEEAKEKLIARQKLVLKQMLKLGFINDEEYKQADEYELVFKKEEIVENAGVQSYFVDAVFEQVRDDLMEQRNMSKAVAENYLYTAGLTIYTTQDLTVQKAIDDAYNNAKIFYKDRAGDFMQSAMVVMDHTNGSVLGLIGGASEKEGARTFNRATQLLRQPGSCMKPLGAYGPAFELGLLSPGAGVDDSQLVNSPGWNPKNYYTGFKGYQTVREAIKQSMNLPAIRANMLVDTSYAFNFVKNCGLKHLVSASQNKKDNDERPAALGIGGLTHGASVLEMCNAYATIANGGVHVEPRLYTKVLDKDGNELLVNNPVSNKVMEDSTAYMLIDCLNSVCEAPGGTARGYVRVKNGAIEVCGKTGNTDKDLDQWFCGFTPYYTIACWNGYDEVGGEPSKGKSINRPYPYACMPLFNTVMNAICSNKEAKRFEQPSSVITAPLCRISGKVATDACRADQRGDQTGVDLVAKGKVPTETCTIHKMVRICPESGKIATEFCPNAEERSFITREGVPAVKPSDWGFMLPGETCNLHTTAQPEEPKVDENKNHNGNDTIINIY